MMRSYYMYLSLSYVYAYRLLGMVSMLAKYSIEGQILGPYCATIYKNTRPQSSILEA